MSHSVFQGGQAYADSEGSHVQDRIHVEADKRSAFDCDEHLRNSALRGSGLAAAHVGIHATRFANLVPGDSHAESSERTKSSSLNRVAEWRASAARCGIVPQTEPHSRGFCPSLWGIFPNLSPARCATIEAWKPRRFKRDPCVAITDDQIAGEPFGLLTGGRRLGKNKYGAWLFECRCACGTVCAQEGGKLIDGTRVTCGRDCKAKSTLPRKLTRVCLSQAGEERQARRIRAAKAKAGAK